MSAGSGIALRPFETGDADAVFAAIIESELARRWLPGLAAVRSVDDVSGYIASQTSLRESGTAYHFAIVDRQDGAFVGACGLGHIQSQNRFANIFYWVRASRLGEGIAPRALIELARFGFENLGLVRVEIVAALENPASIRVAEKSGAQREGTLRQRITIGERVFDAAVFSLIPDDLAPGRE